jgi:NADPH-dependent 2,4-dienoyl-CoA reductase/sulfur reductase-like enzyme
MSLRKTDLSTLGVAVIGTGPAGEQAGRRLLQAGVQVCFFDEQPRTGGNVGRRAVDAPPSPLERLAADGALRLERGCRVLRVGDDGLVEYERAGQRRQRHFAAVVLACGAYDLHHPLPGTPSPRICSAGALQALLKAQGTVPAGRIVIAGSGPFLYVAAADLLRRGAEVSAVVDRLTPADYLRLAPWGLLLPGNTLEFVQTHALLMRHRVPLYRGVGITQVEERELHLASGAVVGFDRLALTELFAPQTQLARTAGCHQRYSSSGGYWVTDTDEFGRSSVAGIYVAGEGQGIRGWRHAAVSGALAAVAVLEDAGLARPGSSTLRWRRRLLARFGAALERRQRAREPLPTRDSVICACEGARYSSVVRAVELGLDDLSSIKVVTRCGMGPCQGRYCEPLVSRVIERAGRIPRAPLNQHVLARPLVAGEFVDGV